MLSRSKGRRAGWPGGEWSEHQERWDLDGR